MRANGYGADIEVTDAAVVIHAGRAAAAVQKTATVTVPLADIADVEYRPAGALTNGSLRLVLTYTDVPLSAIVKAAAPGAGGRDEIARKAAQYAVRMRSYGADPDNRVNPESLVVHWRRKDQASFEAIRDEITRYLG